MLAPFPNPMRGGAATLRFRLDRPPGTWRCASTTAPAGSSRQPVYGERVPVYTRRRWGPPAAEWSAGALGSLFRDGGGVGRGARDHPILADPRAEPLSLRPPGARHIGAIDHEREPQAIEPRARAAPSTPESLDYHLSNTSRYGASAQSKASCLIQRRPRPS